MTVANSPHNAHLQMRFVLHIALWPLNYRRQPMDSGDLAEPADHGVESAARGA